MTTQLQIINTARIYLGTPFINQGRTEKGLDCAGLIIQVVKDLELIDLDYDFLRYGIGNPPERLLNEMDRYLISKPKKQKTISDILVFSLPVYPCHLAFYTGDSIIHSWNKIGKVCETRWDNFWTKRLTHCFGIPGVNPCN